MVLMSSTLPLTGLAADSIRKIAASGEDQFTQACPFNGTADFVFTDADHDGRPGPGDSIRVTYRDCLVSQFEQTGSGTFLVSLGDPAEPSTAEDRFYSGTIDARQLILELRSIVAFDLQLGLLQEVHRVHGDVEFRIHIDGDSYRESLVELDVVKLADFRSARNEIRATGTLYSELLEGSLRFDAARSLSGYLNTYPEQGRMELIGAQGSRVAAIPYNVPQSTLATIAVDAAGNGSFAELPDRPFWSSLVPDFTWSYMPTNQQYVRPFEENDFWFVGGGTERDELIPVGSSLRLQYSRELDASSVPATLTIMRTLEEPPFIEEYEVQTDVRGAAVLLRPLQQLRHGARYTYPMQGFTVEDVAGNSVYTCCGYFTTPDNLSAVARAIPPFGVSGTTVDLDGGESASRGASVTRWSWSQVTGPKAQLAGASQPVASLTVPPVAGQSLLGLRLQVTDSNGELEWDDVDVHAFETIADIGLLYFHGEDGEDVTLGREWILSKATGTMIVERNFYNGIDVGFGTWRLNLVAAGDVRIERGVYENAVRFQTIGSEHPELSLGGDGRGCNTSNGRFEVLDVAYGPDEDVTRAAIDFEQICEESGGLLKGYLRIGSDLPFPVASTAD